jgi:hypothetical protein
MTTVIWLAATTVSVMMTIIIIMSDAKIRKVRNNFLDFKQQVPTLCVGQAANGDVTR